MRNTLSLSFCVAQPLFAVCTIFAAQMLNAYIFSICSILKHTFCFCMPLRLIHLINISILYRNVTLHCELEQQAIRKIGT